MQISKVQSRKMSLQGVTISLPVQFIPLHILPSFSHQHCYKSPGPPQSLHLLITASAFHIISSFPDLVTKQEMSGRKDSD